MSYPYGLDLIMGSKMNAIGGNILLETIISDANQGEFPIPETKVFF